MGFDSSGAILFNGGEVLMKIKFSKSVLKRGKYYCEIDLDGLIAQAYMTEKDAKSLAKQIKKEGF